MNAPRLIPPLLLLGLLLFPSAARTAPAEDGMVPERDLRALERVARDLAKDGLDGEAGVLIEVLGELGLSGRSLSRLEDAREKHAGEGDAKTLRKAGPKAAEKIREEVAGLAGLLEGLEGDERVRLAGLLVRLDAGCAAAQEALGREKLDGRYVPEAVRPLLERRRIIEDAAREARRLPVDARPGGEPHPVLAEALEGPVHVVKVGGDFELHGALPEERLARIARESYRASAFWSFLLTGGLKPPVWWQRVVCLLTTRDEDYQRVLTTSVRRGLMTEEERDFLGQLRAAVIYEPETTLYIQVAHLESLAESALAYRLFVHSTWPEVEKESSYFGRAQPCLLGGLANYACLTILGRGIPGLVSQYESGTGPTVAPSDADEDRLQTIYPRCGLAGHLRRILYLVREDRDPPWVRTMLDRVGRIEGDELIKATSMAQFLAERRPLLQLFRETWPETRDFEPGTPAPLLEKALGMSLDAVERKWRAWLLPPGGDCLVARLEGGSAPEELTAGEREARDAVNAVRAEAGLGGVGVDRVLSEGCRRHARYLGLHPEQAAKWPDAHEEYPDREGFTVDGAWAGAHSVIAPGAGSAQSAVHCWMGTFYHRLPLLHAGLVQIGYAEEAGMAVLDSCSLVQEPYEAEDERFAVVWPPDGARGVPVAFVPELPNPVPGEDQSSFGYPVTLQAWWWWTEEALARDVRLSLHVGSDDGPEVPCHLSTPNRPTNPDLVPANSWCLIPRGHLQKGTKYVAVAVFEPEGDRITWKFTTGS